MTPEEIIEYVLKEKFDTLSAQHESNKGLIESWVHRYLSSGYWANPELSDGLKAQKRWWHGPIQMELADLSRVVGIEPEMEFQVSENCWFGLTGQMSQTLTDPLSIPPLIAEYRDGELSIRDGNTRHGAMTLKGWNTCWVIIWYNSEIDYHHHNARLSGEHL